MRVRRDAWKLDVDDEVFQWYAKAVTAMKALPASDSRSWWYQAGVHGHYLADPAWGGLKQPLPTNNAITTFWDQCQHGSWHFLSWHRMYLAVFEQSIASMIKELGGPEWALPYWDYSDKANPDARKLPPAFSLATTGGVANPLYVARTVGTASRPELNPADVDLDAMDEPDFDSGPFGGTGFGGGSRPPTHHANRMGALEGTPHGAVHIGVGGYMRDPDTAALDPIFWLHHANIDRLWQRWLDDDPVHNNPNDVSWLTEPFDFVDHAGAVATFTAADVLDTTQILGGYVYEGLQGAGGAQIQGDAGAAAQGDSAMANTIVPEMVGATAGPIKLGAQATDIGFALEKASGPVAGALDSGTLPDVFLNFENVTAKQLVDAYDVYVNVPNGDLPQTHPEQHAGVLSMFGVVNASSKDKGGTGDGLNYTLRITRLVRELSNKNAWRWNRIRVTLVPRDEPTPNAELKVGRISVYLK